MVLAPGSVGDDTGEHLVLGQGDDGVLVDALASEVVLAPTAAARFGSDALPRGWSTSSYVEGGTASLDKGALRLAGARVGTDALFLGNRSLDFEATFAPRPDQNVGFGLDFLNVPWVMFGTKWGRRLYARTHFVVSEDKKLAGDWLGEAHRFRIAWRVLDVLFEIDGERVAKILVPMPPLMRPLAANLRTDGTPLTVSWMRMSPYRPSGCFTSRVLDAGRPVVWGEPQWDMRTPEATAVAVGVRTGSTEVPDDRSWSPWHPPSPAGAGRNTPSRYLQYRADLSTADPAVTPSLRGFSVDYGR